MPDRDDGRWGSGLWIRVRQALQSRSSGPPADLGDLDGGRVHSTKALPRILEILSQQSAPVLVDLGPVIGSNVSFLGDLLGCKLHLEDLFGDVDRLVRAGREPKIKQMLEGCLAQDPASVDAVLAWDFIDYLTFEEGAVLAGRIVRVLRPGGVVLAAFSTHLHGRSAYRQFIIEGGAHIRHRWRPYSRPPQRVLLGRDVERLLAPLEVAESYLLAHRLRETILRRPKQGEKDEGTAWPDRSSRS